MMKERVVTDPVTLSELRVSLRRILEAARYFGRRHVNLCSGDAV